MSQQRVATRSSSRLKVQELGGEKGGEDELSQNQGQGQGPVVTPYAPMTKDDFMAMDDFRRLLNEEESGDYLIYRKAAEAREERNKLVTQVIFLLNITKVGDHACCGAANLVLVEIPEGVERIGAFAFADCTSLTTVSFQETLKSIGEYAFGGFSSLDSVDLLHTNLQELGEGAFEECSELKRMTIPDSLQTLGDRGDTRGEVVFYKCFKLVPSYIHVELYEHNNIASKVAGYIRIQQRFSALEKVTAEHAAENGALNVTIVNQATEIAALKVAALTTEITALEIANAPAPHTNDFISTIDFKRHFVGFVHVEMLLVLREVCKEWNDVVVERVDEIVESGELVVRGREDLQYPTEARKERRQLVTRVIFLLNVTKVGEHAFLFADNLFVVDIPEGVESIGAFAFACCYALTTISFPATSTSIGTGTFDNCHSLENVDLLHTKLQELGDSAFHSCRELKSMTIPDSLQTLGGSVFYGCSKLVPSNIDINCYDKFGVIAYLRSLQK
ncbi:hypothetical protein TL16_g01277 [Triparma laevis f. inornata]|uniref:Uncharacterized protein n=1 Tax=Triparma laevis f. inornata TaxID=1714386 RepID=A0A9W6ZE34_9STRA|nr:hypothetical protein TL16_g01277 [Triparma laevis f. inornata]